MPRTPSRPAGPAGSAGRCRLLSTICLAAVLPGLRSEIRATGGSNAWLQLGPSISRRAHLRREGSMPPPTAISSRFSAVSSHFWRSHWKSALLGLIDLVDMSKSVHLDLRMNRCEYCSSRRASSRWCPGCSSIDPFPRRRRILRGALAFALMAVFVVVLFSSSAIAQRRLVQEISSARSFRVPR